MTPFSRRLLLAGPASLVLGSAASAPPPGTSPPRITKPAPAGLNARAQHKGLFYGAAIDHAVLR